MAYSTVTLFARKLDGHSVRILKMLYINVLSNKNNNTIMKLLDPVPT